MIPEERQIYVSGRLWHEIYPKVNLTPFIHVLHESIDLSKYGDALKKFYFTFIIVKPEDKINRPGRHFNKKNKAADISIQIPYHQILTASESETIKLMESAYLEGIEQLRTLPLKGPLNIDKLKQDVQAIFALEEWYKRIPAA